MTALIVGICFFGIISIVEGIIILYLLDEVKQNKPDR